MAFSAVSAGFFLAGLGVGTLATILAARWQIRRSLAKARAAERKAVEAQRLAEVGAMTSGLAHEIKNPLSTIGLNAQLLAEGLEELGGDHDARQRLARRLASLRREVERLRGILTDFLNYAGELRLDIQPTDLNALVREMVDFFEPQATQQGVRILTDLWPQPLRATVDAGHVKQALLNLMLNATHAMATNAPEAPRQLMLQTARADEQPGPDANPRAHIRITDTGPGIPHDVLQKLFTPYFTTKAGGSGLGLATTRRLIEAQGGSVAVISDVGKGTSFTLLLPASID
jgi:signal transduction histidine kinase